MFSILKIQKKSCFNIDIDTNPKNDCFANVMEFRMKKDSLCLGSYLFNFNAIPTK